MKTGGIEQPNKVPAKPAVVTAPERHDKTPGPVDQPAGEREDSMSSQQKCWQPSISALHEPLLTSGREVCAMRRCSPLEPMVGTGHSGSMSKSVGQLTGSRRTQLGQNEETERLPCSMVSPMHYRQSQVGAPASGYESR